MPPLSTADDVQRLVGGALTIAAGRPELRSQLAAPRLVLEWRTTAPDASVVHRLVDPPSASPGAASDADVTVRLAAAACDRFFSGDFNLAIGVSAGKVVVEGDLDRLLAAVERLRVLFPIYRELRRAGRPD